MDYLTGLGLILLCIVLGSIKWNNQAEMPLEKYEDFLEVYVKESSIKSSQTCLGQMFGVWKTNQTLMLVEKLARNFWCQTRVMQV